MKKGWKVFSALLYTLLLSGCGLIPTEDEGRSVALVEDTPLPAYQVEEVTYRNLQSYQILSATYGYVGSQDYYFNVSGVLSTVYVKEGDTVRPGQPLACLESYEEAEEDVEEYTARLWELSRKQEELQAQMGFLKREAEIRYRYGEISETEYQSRLAEIDEEFSGQLQELEDEIYIDELYLEQARASMEEGLILADREGIVSEVLEPVNISGQQLEVFMQTYGSGALEQAELMQRRLNSVNPDTAVVTLSEAEGCAFVCTTEYTDHFQVGQDLVLTIGENREIPVIVNEIQDHTMILQPVETDYFLDIGVSARYTLVLGGQEDVLSLASSAIHEGTDGYYVYFVDEDGRRIVRMVEIGMVGNIYTEITRGLEEGDLVVRR